MPLEATYLAWVDFSGTGMTRGRVHRRVEKAAGSPPTTVARFGAGGETFLRFNIGTPRAPIVEAVARLQQGLRATSQ